jgi:hypothetical protein
MTGVVMEENFVERRRGNFFLRDGFKHLFYGKPSTWKHVWNLK